MMRLNFSSTPLSDKCKALLLLLVIAECLSGSIAYAQDGWRNADELFEAMQLSNGSWVADIGCREGYYTTRMSPIVGSGWIFAVDINPNALKDLQDNLKAAHIENVTPVLNIPESPMLPRDILDAALIRNTYHEFTEPLNMLRYIRRELKKGGRLVIAEAISENLQNSGRARQARSHEIAMKFVKEDLAKVGYRVIREVDPFTEVRRGRHFWMLIAVPINK
ncbi:MAG TPA: methyltransferase domain-containing protein [Balneolaceae bacterium]|nr:methyltransferase domain-containing protein [Balneolaceae bacterium]